jgi:hypothetical protein
METTETELTTPAAQPQLVLGPEAQSYLREAGKWANFLAILGFIICAIILAVSFSIGGNIAKMATTVPGPMAAFVAGMGGIISVVYILMDVIYFLLSLYLYQFANQIKKGIMFTDNVQVTSALGKLKSFFKLWGIVTIVALCLYALAIIVVIVVVAGASSMMNH